MVALPNLDSFSAVTGNRHQITKVQSDLVLFYIPWWNSSSLQKRKITLQIAAVGV